MAPAPAGVRHSGPLSDVLAALRYIESRGRYHIPPNRGNASGAYQFIATTWQNYGGYAHAYLAPPHLQDERAALDVQHFLDQWHGDVSMVAVMWYYPKAAKDPSLMDVVPLPSAGNVLTVREYQRRFLSVLSTISGDPVARHASHGDSTAHRGLPPTPIARDDDLPSVTYPVLGPSRPAIADCDEAALADGTELSRDDLDATGLCAEHPPSIVFGVKLQPIAAVADGVVTAVRDEPGAPISVTITDLDGRSYVYSGFNDDSPGTNDGAAPDHLRLTALAAVGRTVYAGQIIGFMGDTDPLPPGVRAKVPTDASVVIDPDATAPHLRLSIVDIDGSPVEAFGPVLDALWTSTCRIAIGPWSVPPRDDRVEPVTVETTDDDRRVDSDWQITERGQVLATGWAAMINPSESCGWTPSIPFGPGGAGSDSVPAHWAVPLELPTGLWLELALASERGAGRATPMIRR